MTALALAVVLSALLVLAAWLARRNAVRRENRRLAALTALAEQLERTRVPARERVDSIAAPSPRVAASSRGVGHGRAACVDAVGAAVLESRDRGARLSLAVVTSTSDPTTVVGAVRSAAGTEVFTVGPDAVAVLLPGRGRAEALGLLARIEAASGAAGRAVELRPDETAVELLARLLKPVAAGD